MLIGSGCTGYWLTTGGQPGVQCNCRLNKRKLAKFEHYVVHLAIFSVFSLWALTYLLFNYSHGLSALIHPSTLCGNRQKHAPSDSSRSVD